MMKIFVISIVIHEDHKKFDHKNLELYGNWLFAGWTRLDKIHCLHFAMSVINGSHNMVNI